MVARGKGLCPAQGEMLNSHWACRHGAGEPGRCSSFFSLCVVQISHVVLFWERAGKPQWGECCFGKRGRGFLHVFYRSRQVPCSEREASPWEREGKKHAMWKRDLPQKHMPMSRHAMPLTCFADTHHTHTPCLMPGARLMCVHGRRSQFLPPLLGMHSQRPCHVPVREGGTCLSSLQ